MKKVIYKVGSDGYLKTECNISNKIHGQTVKVGSAACSYCVYHQGEIEYGKNSDFSLLCGSSTYNRLKKNNYSKNVKLIIRTLLIEKNYDSNYYVRRRNLNLYE